jgi:hypothetical protein
VAPLAHVRLQVERAGRKFRRLWIENFRDLIVDGLKMHITTICGEPPYQYFYVVFGELLLERK